MQRRIEISLLLAAMVAVVVASNMLVQVPVGGMVGNVNLADLLTYGAFTYPLAFLVTDLANRSQGPATARFIVLAGFVVAVLLSVWLATPRIAVASGTAFLVGQLLDISVFNRLRNASWWVAPWIASVVGSIVDTAIFFSLAFAPTFGFLGPDDAFALEAAPFLGAFEPQTMRYISCALPAVAQPAFTLPRCGGLITSGRWPGSPAPSPARWCCRRG
jgi:queuosine precursor transporter